jgi:hypothetical protein
VLLGLNEDAQRPLEEPHVICTVVTPVRSVNVTKHQSLAISDLGCVMSRPAVDHLTHTQFLVADGDVDGGPDFDSFAVEANESPDLAVFSIAWPMDPPAHSESDADEDDVNADAAPSDEVEKKDEPHDPASTDSEEDTDGEPPPKRYRQSLFHVDQALFSSDSPADGGCQFHHLCNAIKDNDDCCVERFYCGHIVCPFFITNSNVSKQTVSINHHQRKCPGCVRNQSSTNRYRAAGEPLSWGGSARWVWWRFQRSVPLQPIYS